MFGDRTPLYQKVEGVEDAKPSVPTIVRPARRGRLRSGSPASREDVATEAPTPPKEIVVETPGAGERAASGTQTPRQAGEAPGLPKVWGEKTKEPPTNFRLKGTLEPGRPPEEQQLEREANERIFRAQRATAAAELVSMGLAEQYQNDYANIGEQDALEGRRLHVEHFSKARRRMDDLYRKVEDARSLKVNPYNWHESIGRGGRVAAAFSLLTGQMAAGAGNPNSALKMMDAAIERDISAQEENIKNTFEAIKLQRNLSNDERQLYEEQLNSLNETRAIAFAAIQGRIAAAQQHAITEGARQSYQVMSDHYNLKLLDSLQASRARILSVEVEGPIRASKIRVIQNEINKVLSGLTTGAAAREGRVPGAIQTGPETGTVGPAPTPPPPTDTTRLPTAPGRAGTVAARRPTRMAPPTGEEQTPTRGPSEAQETAIQPSGLGAPADTKGPFRTGLDITEAPEPPRAIEKPPLSGDELGQQYEAGRSALPPHVAKVKLPDGRIESGYGLAEDLNQGAPTSSTTGLREATDALAAGKPIPNDGFRHQWDALEFSKIAAEYEPQRKNYSTPEAYNQAMRFHRYKAKKAEFYEQPGGQNAIFAGGHIFRTRAGSLIRGDSAASRNLYNEVAEKLVEGNEYVTELRQMAERYVKVGPGGNLFSGFFNAEEGAFSLPGVNSTDPATKQNAQSVIQLAMGFIKQNDPTARLSDKDLEVGEKAMGFLLTGKLRFLDFVQSFDGKYNDNTVRQHMNRYLRVLAQKAQVAYFKKYESYLIPDHNTMVAITQQTDATQKWLNTNIADDDKDNPQVTQGWK